jgi:hypothetical protein
MATNKKDEKKGDCDVCERTDVSITLHHGNIWFCEPCWTDEEKKLTANAKELIEQSHKIDEAVQVKSDLFNAATIPAMELRAAIQQNSEIPDDQKEYAFAKESMRRFELERDAVFSQRKELLERENVMKMWQITTQTAAGKLRAELREQFKALNVNYQPPASKITKPGPVKTGKKLQKEEIYAALKKYELDSVFAPAIQTMVLAKNLTPDQAARHQSFKLKGVDCDCPICTRKVG